MHRRWILGALALGAIACGSSEGRSIDFGEGAGPPSRPRDRPYPCPNVEPTPGSQCGTNALTCGYGDGSCQCVADPRGNFGTLAWSCDFGPAEACPEAQPRPETACTTLFGAPECEYGPALTCHCASDAQVWACWNPADCARRRPAEQSACDLLGMTCRYADATCECQSEGWRCE